jgi:hypothetical protein
MDAQIFRGYSESVSLDNRLLKFRMPSRLGFYAQPPEILQQKKAMGTDKRPLL